MASTKRSKLVFQYLLDEGVAKSELKRVHSPAGLDFGGTTPEEIALSIIAEMVSIRRGGTGSTMMEIKQVNRMLSEEAVVLEQSVSNSSPDSRSPQLDLSQIRNRFPILSREIHGHPLAFLDNASTTQKPDSVIQAMVDFSSSRTATSAVGFTRWQKKRPKLRRSPKNSCQTAECCFRR